MNAFLDFGITDWRVDVNLECLPLEIDEKVFSFLALTNFPLTLWLLLLSD